VEAVIDTMHRAGATGATELELEELPQATSVIVMATQAKPSSERIRSCARAQASPRAPRKFPEPSHRNTDL
jgi:hypothetical protein